MIRLTISSAVGLLLAAAVGAPAAGANIPGSPPDGLLSQPATQAPGARVAEFAKAAGVDTSTADRGLQLQDKAHTLTADLRGRLRGAGFAGVEFDAKAGRFLIPVADDDLGAVRAALTDRALQNHADVYRVEHSLVELEAAQSVLAKALTAQFNRHVVSQAIDVARNEIVVRRSSAATSADLASIEEAKRLIEVPVRVESAPASEFEVGPSACGTLGTRPDCDRPLRGGVRIWNSTTNKNCSAGAHAFLGATRFIVTAGHCNNTLGGNWVARHFSSNTDQIIGQRYDQRYDASGDISLVRVNSNSFWQMTGWTPESIIWGWAADWQHNAKAWSYVGEQVCWTGQNSVGCAVVNGLGVGVTYSDGTYVGGITRAAYSSGCVVGGTSGGSVEDGHYILGVVSATSGCTTMYYNEVLRAEQIWGVSIATTG